MREISRVTEDTPINSEETKELIERLSDPSFVTGKNQATVKDLAETLDMDPEIVAAGLERLRQEKLIHVPESAETYLGDRLSANRPYAKMASAMIVGALLVMALCFFFLFQPASIAPPAQTAVQKVPVQPASEAAPTPPPK